MRAPLVLLLCGLAILSFPSPAPPAISEKAISLYNQANAARREGKAEEAIRLLREALQVSPELYLAHHALGELHLERGELAEARNALLRAVELSPTHRPSRVALARLAERLGEGELALLHYEEALRLLPDDPFVHFRLGLLRKGRGQGELAIRHLRAALKLEEGHAGARYWLWWLLAEGGGRRENEVELGRSLVEAGDERPIAHYRARARLHYEGGRYAEAVREAEKAVAVNPRWREDRWRPLLDELARYRRAAEEERGR